MYSYKIPVTAGADLQSAQYKVINISGTLAVSPPTSLGILFNKPDSGEDASLVYMGRSKFAAGAAITAGAELTVESGGWVITATSGDRVIGVSRLAVVSGGVGEDGVFNFAAKGYKTT